MLAPGEDGDVGSVAKFKYFSEQLAGHAHRRAGLSAMWEAGAGSGEAGADVVPAKVVDLTAAMDSSGVVHWDVPEGNWEILRFGRTSLGVRAKVGGSSSPAYQVDYLDPETMKIHFTKGIDPMLEASGLNKDKTLLALHEDSFEMPFNRWTGAFASEFRKRRGYDLFPWLPVLAGRFVESKGASERFLWDYRSTWAA